MNNNTTSVEKLLEKAENYGKTSIELFKLKTLDKTVNVASALAVRLAIFMVVVLFLIIINIGISLWLGELLGKSYYGFFVVAACNALIALLLHTFLRQSIKDYVSNSIIKKLLNQNVI